MFNKKWLSNPTLANDDNLLFYYKKIRSYFTVAVI